MQWWHFQNMILPPYQVIFMWERKFKNIFKIRKILQIRQLWDIKKTCLEINTLINYIRYRNSKICINFHFLKMKKQLLRKETVTFSKKIPCLIFEVEEKKIWMDVWEYLTVIETPELKWLQYLCTVGLKFRKEKNADN